jgi:hypothetical protein
LTTSAGLVGFAGAVTVGGVTVTVVGGGTVTVGGGAVTVGGGALVGDDVAGADGEFSVLGGTAGDGDDGDDDGRATALAGFPPLDPVRLDTAKYTPPPMSSTNTTAATTGSHGRRGGSGADSSGGRFSASGLAAASGFSASLVRGAPHTVQCWAGATS